MQDLSEAYKETMSYWPSGVAVVTTEHDGKSYGMTVSSFTSVSLTPPMVSVCIDKRAQMCGLFEKSGQFTIHILKYSQIDLAKIFSNHQLNMSQRFEQAGTKLEKALGSLDCKLSSFHDTGDHMIYVGEVRQAGSCEGADPLIFYRRDWHRVEDIKVV